MLITCFPLIVITITSIFQVTVFFQNYCVFAPLQHNLTSSLTLWFFTSTSEKHNLLKASKERLSPRQRYALSKSIKIMDGGILWISKNKFQMN